MRRKNFRLLLDSAIIGSICLFVDVAPADAAGLACSESGDRFCDVSETLRLSAQDPGALRFKLCRSHDTQGWGGCNVLVADAIIAEDGVATIELSGVDLPSEGSLRAYYVSSCDDQGCSAWSQTPPVYARRDLSPPEVRSAGTSASWTVDSGDRYLIVAEAEDSVAGVAEIRVQVDRGSEHGSLGLVSWNVNGFTWGWSDEKMACSGGGFASKRPGQCGSLAFELLGCSTSVAAGLRRVSFEVEPNPSFGRRTSLHDLSVRAFDRLDHRSDWRDFDLNFESVRSRLHQAESIGYQGILDGLDLLETVDAGVPVDVATLIYQRKECTRFYWRQVDTGGILADYRAMGAKAMVVLENFLFLDVNDPIGEDCEPLEPPPPLDPSACYANQKWRLAADWRSRLAEFDALAGDFMTIDNVELLLVSSEVNDRCFDLSQVEEVALEVKALYPDLPVAMIYGATHGADGRLQSPPAPSYFPAIFDVVGVFSYNLFDVMDPYDPRNATTSFYDPQAPENAATVYGDLLSKLHPHQSVLLVFEANLGGPKLDLGWEGVDLAEVASNYETFISHRPEIETIGGFTWDGLLSLPQSVVDFHSAMACRLVRNDSPLCP